MRTYIELTILSNWFKKFFTSSSSLIFLVFQWNILLNLKQPNLTCQIKRLYGNHNVPPLHSAARTIDNVNSGTGSSPGWASQWSGKLYGWASAGGCTQHPSVEHPWHPSQTSARVPSPSAPGGSEDTKRRRVRKTAQTTARLFQREKHFECFWHAEWAQLSDIHAGCTADKALRLGSGSWTGGGRSNRPCPGSAEWKLASGCSIRRHCKRKTKNDKINMQSKEWQNCFLKKVPFFFFFLLNSSTHYNANRNDDNFFWVIVLVILVRDTRKICF